jgi:hypothetical protein
MTEVVFLLQRLHHVAIDLAAGDADGVIAQLGDAGDVRPRRRHDHDDALRRDGDGARLREVADIGPHHRKIGVPCRKSLGGIKHVAGVLDLESDRGA